jgi:hypothetical protein
MSLAGEAGGRARLYHERLCSESPLLIITAFARGCRWSCWSRLLPLFLRQQTHKDVLLQTTVINHKLAGEPQRDVSSLHGDAEYRIHAHAHLDICTCRLVR